MPVEAQSSIDPEFLDLMTPGWSVRSYLGDDTWGNASYASSVSFMARYESKERRRGQGTQAATEQQAKEDTETGSLIPDRKGFKPRDEITSPHGSTMHVLRVETEYDEFGPYNERVYVEEARP